MLQNKLRKLDLEMPSTGDNEGLILIRPVNQMQICGWSCSMHAEAIIMWRGVNMLQNKLWWVVGSFHCPRAECVSIMNLMMFAKLPLNLLAVFSQL